MNPNQAMTDSLGEQLSALLDGELERDQVRFLLRGVAVQSDLIRRWTNYQLIGAGLKREYVALALPANFVDSVIGRLEAELPAAASPARRIGFAALRWVGGGAIAAAVAVVALTTSRPQTERSGGAPAIADRVQAAQPYLPLAHPPSNANFLPFDYGAIRPASYEQVLPDYNNNPKDGVPLLPVPVQSDGYRGRYYLLRVQQTPVRDSAQTATAAQQ
jgi:sigma-E factor negative regulatory protein RseA